MNSLVTNFPISSHNLFPNLVAPERGILNLPVCSFPKGILNPRPLSTAQVIAKVMRMTLNFSY